MQTDHAWIIAREHGTRARHIAAAIRKAQARALAVADEADDFGHHGIARTLRRKATAPRPRDIDLRLTPSTIRVTIRAWSVSVEYVSRA